MSFKRLLLKGSNMLTNTTKQRLQRWQKTVVMANKLAYRERSNIAVHWLIHLKIDSSTSKDKQSTIIRSKSRAQCKDFSIPYLNRVRILLPLQLHHIITKQKLEEYKVCIFSHGLYTCCTWITQLCLALGLLSLNHSLLVLWANRNVS